jgi:exonuclease SbcC
MRVLRVEIQNFKPFRNITIPEEGELPTGLLIIKGENSTGKSSLFEAILWCLWGPDVVEPTNDELVSFTSSFCKVIVTFEVTGSQYKLERSYDQASGIDVILYQKIKNGWKRIADKSKSVSSKMEEILHLDWRQALQTLLVRQGEVALIANATPAVLRDLIIKIYNIELLGTMTNHLENLESDINNQVATLDKEHTPESYLIDLKEKTELRLKEHEDALDGKKNELIELEKQVKKLPDMEKLRKIQDIQKERDEAKRDFDRAVKNRDSELDDAGIASADETVVSAKLDILKKETEKVENKSKHIESEREIVDQEVGHLISRSEELREQITALEEIAEDSEDTIDCPTCGKPLSPSDRKRLLSESKHELNSGKKRLLELKQKRDDLSKVRTETDSKIRTIASAIDAIDRIKKRQEDVDATKRDLDVLDQKLASSMKESGVKDLDRLLKDYKSKSLLELQSKVSTIESRYESLQNECNAVKDHIKHEKEQIEKIEKDILRSREISAEIESLKLLYEHAKYVRLKLVNGFVSDYVVQKRLIGIVRGATNPYVRAFTNDQYSSVDLIATPASTRSGSGLVIKIRDERDNATKKTSQLSFGDRTAISLALRLGISRTMSAIRPTKNSPAIAPRVRCVLLDEPLGGLDKNRRQSVVRNLVNDASFEQIFLITHTDIQEWDEVPTIDVSKSGTSSSAVLQM